MGTMELDGTRFQRPALNFDPVPVSNPWETYRHTSLINSYSSTAGSFATGVSNCSFNQSGATTPVENFVSIAFRLDDLKNYTEYTALFDQYCIRGVRVTIMPRASNAVVSGSASNLGPQTLYVAKDQSDIVLPPDLATLREYSTVKLFSTTTMNNRIWIVDVSPRAAIAAFSGTFTGYSDTGELWCDTESPSIQHYGIKMGLPPGVSGGSTTIYDIDFEYHLAFRLAQ